MLANAKRMPQCQLNLLINSQLDVCFFLSFCLHILFWRMSIIYHFCCICLHWGKSCWITLLWTPRLAPPQHLIIITLTALWKLPVVSVVSYFMLVHYLIERFLLDFALQTLRSEMYEVTALSWVQVRTFLTSVSLIRARYCNVRKRWLVYKISNIRRTETLSKCLIFTAVLSSHCAIVLFKMLDLILHLLTHLLWTTF